MKTDFEELSEELVSKICAAMEKYFDENYPNMTEKDVGKISLVALESLVVASHVVLNGMEN